MAETEYISSTIPAKLNDQDTNLLTIKLKLVLMP